MPLSNYTNLVSRILQANTPAISNIKVLLGLWHLLHLPNRIVSKQPLGILLFTSIATTINLSDR